jgi:hypothetical protein
MKSFFSIAIALLSLQGFAQKANLIFFCGEW